MAPVLLHLMYSHKLHFGIVGDKVENKYEGKCVLLWWPCRVSRKPVSHYIAYSIDVALFCRYTESKCKSTVHIRTCLLLSVQGKIQLVIKVNSHVARFLF
jgi:hypothetical protein